MPPRRPKAIRATPRIMKSLTLDLAEEREVKRALRQTKQSFNAYARRALLAQVAADLGAAA